MDECLFCAIAEKKIPSYVVYEDNLLIAILDRNPANPGHVLIIPKSHVVSLLDLDENVYLHCFGIARTLARAVLQAIGAKGINILYSFGPAAGQRLPHAFIHLIPRFEGDKVQIAWDREPAKEDDLKLVQSRIVEALFGPDNVKRSTQEQHEQETPKPQQTETKEKKEEPESKEETKQEKRPRIPSYW